MLDIESPESGSPSKNNRDKNSPPNKSHLCLCAKIDSQTKKLQQLQLKLDAAWEQFLDMTQILNKHMNRTTRTPIHIKDTLCKLQARARLDEADDFNTDMEESKPGNVEEDATDDKFASATEDVIGIKQPTSKRDTANPLVSILATDALQHQKDHQEHQQQEVCKWQRQ